uniref:Uncharacterized protein n=1 Tax=Phytophthora fragariae TaxID=53985 RepID=A0A6A3FN19_9STRA|nr:hypothetical protein PF009_g7143 [Phytophthora fragariae]
MEEDIDMDDGEQPFTGAPQSAMPLTVDGEYASVDPHTIPSATARASEIPQSSSIGGNGAADEVRRHHPHLDSPTGLVPIDTGAEAGMYASFLALPSSQGAFVGRMRTTVASLVHSPVGWLAWRRARPPTSLDPSPVHGW